MERLSDVEVFVRVVEKSSFSKAADTLGISRSYASRMVAGLEKRLGVRLLHRTTRSVAATATGQAFYEASGPLVEGIAVAEARVREEGRAPTGTLRVSLPLAFGLQHMLEPLRTFQEQHPEVRLVTQFDDRKVDLIAEGFDLALRGGSTIEGPFVAKALWRFRVLPMASPAYLARAGAPAHPRELASLPCLVYGGSQRPDSWSFARGDERVDVRVEGPLVSNAAPALRHFALAGAGIALLPDWTVIDDVRTGALVHLLPGWDPPGFRFWLVRPDRRHVPERVRAFSDHLSATFPDPEWLKIA